MGVGGWRTTKTEYMGFAVLWIVSGHGAWELIAYLVRHIGWE
jgi:hypothetical protein